MTRDKALELLHKNVVNHNLRRHCYAVEAVMRALYQRLEDGNKTKEEEDKWGIAGLIHDADYELTKDDEPKKNHTKLVLKWLRDADTEAGIYDAVASHGWGYVDGAPMPVSNLQWALYTCDELTGMIAAVALVKPDKKLASVTVDSILKKWNSRVFAAGVNRKQIEECENKLGIPLREFIEISLKAMQGIHEELGL
jgi:uncharacterized protein